MPHRTTLRRWPCIAAGLALFAFAVPAIAVAQQPQAAEPQSAPDPAEPARPIPPPRTQYMGRTIAPTMSFHGAAWLTRASRQREEHTDELLAALAIRPGQVVADIGCGNGYYTLKLARLVGPRGRVLAVDIQSEMLSLLKARAEEAGLANIRPILGTPIDPMLPAGEVDLLLLVDVYHEFSHPELMLRAMRRSLKPSGRLVLVEFRGEDPAVPIKPLHKMTKAQIMKELPPNGYRLVEQYDKLPWQHVMIFARQEAEAGQQSAAPLVPARWRALPPQRLPQPAAVVGFSPIGPQAVCPQTCLP